MEKEGQDALEMAEEAQETPEAHGQAQNRHPVNVRLTKRKIRFCEEPSATTVAEICAKRI